jgi:lipid-binding SYLF domain-containing protein
MFKTSARTAGLLLSSACALAACASPKTLDEAKVTANESQATLNAFLSDMQMTWLHQNIGRAKAILISPRMIQAGFVVGGAGGNAVLTARKSGSPGWTGPAFYKLATGSIGLQIGAEKAELVGLVMTDKALNSFLSSSFKFGGDVSVAAGPVGAGAGAPINADIVIFTRSKGLYGGLNLSGTAVNTDDTGNSAFYGHAAMPPDILVTHSAANSAGQAFAQAVANAAAKGQPQ